MNQSNPLSTNRYEHLEAPDREEHTFELRNSHGTQWLAWHPEKNFTGMYAEFQRALQTGDV